MSATLSAMWWACVTSPCRRTCAYRSATNRSTRSTRNGMGVLSCSPWTSKAPCWRRPLASSRWLRARRRSAFLNRPGHRTLTNSARCSGSTSEYLRRSSTPAVRPRPPLALMILPSRLAPKPWHASDRHAQSSPTGGTRAVPRPVGSSSKASACSSPFRVPRLCSTSEHTSGRRPSGGQRSTTTFTVSSAALITMALPPEGSVGRVRTQRQRSLSPAASPRGSSLDDASTPDPVGRPANTRRIAYWTAATDVRRAAARR